MMALVAAGTWNCRQEKKNSVRGSEFRPRSQRETKKRTSSATYLSTAVNGACSGTFTLHSAPKIVRLAPFSQGKQQKHSKTHTRYGSLGSEVSVTLNVTFPDLSAAGKERQRRQQRSGAGGRSALATHMMALECRSAGWKNEK